MSKSVTKPLYSYFSDVSVDSILEHWEILFEELWSLVPVVFSAFGFVISLIAVIQWKETRIRMLKVVLYAAFAVAVAGVYSHLEEDEEEDSTTEQIQEENKEKEKPPLAPILFAGLAGFGLAATSKKWM